MMTTAPIKFDAVVIGGGAAGLMCAMAAGQRGRRVVLIEHTNKVGAKILISGGGRCNFTNLDVAPHKFISSNPQFCRSALSRYTQHDFIALVRRHGISFHEKTLGQLFCDGSARAIVAMLSNECAAAGVDVRVNEAVQEVSRSDAFTVVTSSGTYVAPSLVMATGGLSIPKMGATGFAHDVARQFGLRVTETLPALVPLRGSAIEKTSAASLAGISVDSIAACGGQSFEEAVLFTHHGLSGPAILQISSYWRPGQSLTLDLLPSIDVSAFLIGRKRTRGRSAIQTVLGEVLPARLAGAVTAEFGVSTEMANIPDRTVVEFASKLKTWSVTPTGTEGYAKAEVTIGGVDTRDLSSKTMGARAVPGLFFIGEAVDVTGWLGGYNFQWAWSSGWAAAQAL